MSWTYVWITDDGPSVGGSYQTEAAATTAAFEDWRGHFGGIAGGYTTGARSEFAAMLQRSPVLWICPMIPDSDTEGAPS